MQFVCPQPLVWKEIYEKLFSAWQEKGQKSAPPPKALILAGWNFSNDFEKKKRWEETCQWAEDNGFNNLIPLLQVDQKYLVEKFSLYNAGGTDNLVIDD